MPHPSRRGLFTPRRVKMTEFRKSIPIFIFCALFFSSCFPSISDKSAPTPILVDPTTPVKVKPAENLEEEKPTKIEGQDCTGQGMVERYQIESEALNSGLFISVYLPPCYDASRAEGYPALYLLHGQTFNDRMWVDLGAPEIADALIVSGQAAPFLMVMPYEEFYYRDDEGNQFPEALMSEVIPWVVENFNVCAGMACRALGGISRGASWAMRIGLTEPGVFSSLGGHSLPTFRGDISALPEWLDAIPDRQMPRVYLDTGRFDPEVKAAYRFEQVLNEKGIPHDWHLNEGRHNEEYWSSQMENYLRWYAAGWEGGE